MVSDSLVDLRRLKIMTSVLAANEQFLSECSVAGTKKLEGKLKV